MKREAPNRFQADLAGSGAWTKARRLAKRGRLVYDGAMFQSASRKPASRSAFADATVRAMISTLLLLGLSGDRRVR